MKNNVFIVWIVKNILILEFFMAKVLFIFPSTSVIVEPRLQFPVIEITVNILIINWRVSSIWGVILILFAIDCGWMSFTVIFRFDLREINKLAWTENETSHIYCWSDSKLFLNFRYLKIHWSTPTKNQYIQFIIPVVKVSFIFSSGHKM